MVVQKFVYPERFFTVKQSGKADISVCFQQTLLVIRGTAGHRGLTAFQSRGRKRIKKQCRQMLACPSSIFCLNNASL